MLRQLDLPCLCIVLYAGSETVSQSGSQAGSPHPNGKWKLKGGKTQKREKKVGLAGNCRQQHKERRLASAAAAGNILLEIHSLLNGGKREKLITPPAGVTLRTSRKPAIVLETHKRRSYVTLIKIVIFFISVSLQPRCSEHDIWLEKYLSDARVRDMGQRASTEKRVNWSIPTILSNMSESFLRD